MRPRSSARPLPKTIPQSGKGRGGYYTYKGDRPWQPKDKKK